MKIFIGTQENCGIIASLGKGFDRLGHEVITWVKARDRFFPDAKYTFDYSAELDPHQGKFGKLQSIPILSRFYTRLFNLYKVIKCRNYFDDIPDADLFIYTWDTILDKWEDLEILKKKGKKIIFIFIGSEARYAHAFNQQFPKTPWPWTPYHLNESINRKLIFIRTVEKFADAIFSLPDQAGLQVRPYMHMYMPFEIDKYQFHYPENDIPVIVHAPSNRAIKGTEFILKALDELKAEGLSFDFRLIENQPNSVVREALINADIAIDQIFAHGPGIFGIEAMASGCALATKYLQSYSSIFAPPVCYIDIWELKENLRKLITNSAYRRDLAYAGPAFIKAHNDPNIIAKTMLEALTATKFDYNPDFFVKSFKLLEKQQLSPKVKKLNIEMIQKYQPEMTNLSLLKQKHLI